MSRSYLKFALAIYVIFAVIALLIHFQPHDDRDLRAFLIADNCDLPCFMGIRPGVTLGNEAVAILQQDDWVDAESIYYAPDITRRFVWVTWRWSENKPDYLWGTGYMTYSPSGDGTVNFIEVRTTIPAGAIRLTLGRPQEDNLIPNEHLTAYPNEGFFVQSFAHCGIFWQEMVNLYIVAPAKVGDVRSQLGLPSDSSTLPPRKQVCRSNAG